MIYNCQSVDEPSTAGIPYLCSTFRSLTGISPVNYIIRKRITEAEYMLINTDKSILTISEECGFRSLSNFNSLFRKITGTTPKNYRKTGNFQISSQ
ncbi:MAG: helix-turn-helix transcriptional regulator [Ruminococcus sp.]|nr:helix-turn-helix transcriptional regulator [Ruminococcus sp.]MDE6797489.1 helix-turn-helix transcriptional regulator [Ruminococcus sp.]